MMVMIVLSDHYFKTYIVKIGRDECLFTLMALLIGFFPMHINVLIEIRFLCECLAAPYILAFEGSLSGVYSEMIEKIMPFSKVHPAKIKIAFEDLDEALCSRVFILVDAESLCRWNVLFYFEAL